MNDLQVHQGDTSISVQTMTLENRLEIIEEYIRNKYLSRLKDMQIADTKLFNLLPLEDDLIDNIRVYKITEMVYQKGEPVTDKLTTVFNTIASYNASTFILLDSDGKKTDIYVGIRNNEKEDTKKRSSVTIGDTLKNTLIGHFPGMVIKAEDREAIEKISDRILEQSNVTSVSVVANAKSQKDQTNEQFIQGLEKLAMAMSGRQYMGLILAENQSPQEIQILRKNYQDLFTKLSPLQKVQFSENASESTSRSKSFSEMDGKQKAAMLGGAAVNLAGVLLGATIGAGPAGVGATGGAMLGGQIMSPLNGFISSLAPSEQMTKSYATTTSTTTENKTVTDLLQLLDEAIKRTAEFDSYGMWKIAGYFISDDMSAAEIAASNYRSLMNGENSGRQVSAINSWRRNDTDLNGEFRNLTFFLSRFMHPKFCYASSQGKSSFADASIAISGKELGLHMGLPRATISGLPVIEHAEFGKEVYKYQLFSKDEILPPEERMTLGKVFDLGQITDKVVELDNKSLNMHTFITGSTGSGKSNTVYQFLMELHQDRIPFLVVEPAKGEYKDVFGHWDDVYVFSTNPKIAELININPFKFPESIHVLEHIDGLVEIFSVCWPMYDAMPAFFKDAILKSYESVGWDLGSSTFDGEKPEYPDFEILADQLDQLIEGSDYASDIKSNYRGALITRVKSLTVGLNKFIFTSEQTPYEILFDKNCILDISRVKSSETKALIMGLMVYILNEYRVDTKSGNNNGLKHITVLEEAHNLLKNTQNGASELTGKSVEMLTQTIAEIRTYGEGFVIVDQSPSSVDIAAIKNTNTKIVLRTPEANDREAVGRPMGLTPDQVNEIAKLPSGVAVVYQNNWVSPVLTMIDKANVTEKEYTTRHKTVIRTLKSARTNIIKMILQPFLKTSQIPERVLKESLRVLELKRNNKKAVEEMISDYTLFGGQLIWNKDELYKIRPVVLDVLDIRDKDILKIDTSEELEELTASRLHSLPGRTIKTICYLITSVKGDR